MRLARLRLVITVIAALALVSTPAYLVFAANQQADAPLSAFLLLAASLLAVALERGCHPRLLLVSGEIGRAHV